MSMQYFLNVMFVLIDTFVFDSAGKREEYQKHRRNSSNNSVILSHLNNEPSVVQDQFKWTIYMSSVNLPAVLNDPRLAKRDTAIFSKTWGEAFERVTVKPSHLQYITYEHFQTYTDNTAQVHMSGVHV